MKPARKRAQSSLTHPTPPNKLAIAGLGSKCIQSAQPGNEDVITDGMITYPALSRRHCCFNGYCTNEQYHPAGRNRKEVWTKDFRSPDLPHREC